jgi:hypothetical protein
MVLGQVTECARRARKTARRTHGHDEPRPSSLGLGLRFGRVDALSELLARLGGRGMHLGPHRHDLPREPVKLILEVPPAVRFLPCGR